MTASDGCDHVTHEEALECIGPTPGQRRTRIRWSGRALAACLAAASGVLAAQPAAAAEPALVKIAVFDFVLEDRSAGGGIIGPDGLDATYLEQSADEARRILAASGRYSVVDTGAAADDVIAAGGFQHCNGCEGRFAGKLGADQAMIGIITRITRTEYTVQLLVRDARTGSVLSNAFTGLRMGANHSWPRGVRWLMNHQILAAQQAD